ncbi:hypothetical protein EK904_004620 [Melospiza melodia maxima]|nr:hypothetical protein EK904_004620 [Melospiza melodia maxima]
MPLIQAVVLVSKQSETTDPRCELKFAVITCSANAYELRDCCGFSLVSEGEWNISGIHRLMDITVACWRKSSVIGFIKGLECPNK